MKRSLLDHLDIYVDGGCLGNGSADTKCYGSFKVVAISIDGEHNEIVKHEQFSLDCSTNNQAEYQSLIRVLEYLKVLKDKGFVMEARIYTDSQIVVHQLNAGFHEVKPWKVKDSDLQLLYTQAKEQLKGLPAITIDWACRNMIVRALGH